MRTLLFSLVVGLLWNATDLSHVSAADLHFGFGKVDITPDKSLRLSGYASRDKPSEGVDMPLFARAMTMRDGHEGPLFVLVSIDTIGFDGELSKTIFERVRTSHPVDRERFVTCSTHTHAAPEMGVLTGMYNVPFTEQQTADTQAYRQQLTDRVVAAIDAAVDDIQPGRLFVGQGEATFAVNRRMIENGIWTGFGVNERGPVDHALPLIRITNASGEKTRGLLFNYACHCTTFGGDYNRMNGDWAGYAAQYLDEKHAGATALCTIGCGADANSQRLPERALELAKAQGREIADEINRLLDTQLKEVTGRPTASFGFAGLPFDRPTKAELEEKLKDARRPIRLHAETMLDTLARKERLPETYPMPIQVWKFAGDDFTNDDSTDDDSQGEQSIDDPFTMVFLGGEVCVDYGLRIKRELGESTWVTAYANDVFGYVAPERMRSEGGYEVDFSMIYYMLPGRWSSGTEDLILKRVHELDASTGSGGALSPEEAKGTFTIPAGFTLDLVAAEPLVRDPIAMAIAENGHDLWVVEMGDYPRGKTGDIPPGEAPAKVNPWDGPPGGVIKLLTDTDRDGEYDMATLFLGEFTLPTGVFAWNDGVLIAAAPDILFARDTDGDGRADEREVLYTGFEEANPQHRINGFTRGLDGWLYLASGTNNGDITSTKTGDVVNMRGRDLRIHPESGRLEPVSGRSQYGRTVDGEGNWFGNENSDPLFHLVIEDRYLRRNPYVAAPTPRVYLTTPSRAPPVYPTSRTPDRFNDLFALNRFTSACSPHVWDDPTHRSETTTDVLVCEPVHNLVSRIVLEPDGVTFRGRRHEDELTSEFLSSTDNWFRPVQLRTTPDGALLICDMYRQVIEHPEWIPDAWQAKLDLYAGYDRGRIWRLRPTSPVELTSQGVRPSGLELLTQQHLEGELTDNALLEALASDDPRVVRWALRFAEPRLMENAALRAAVARLSTHDDIRVRYHTALSLGEFTNHDTNADDTQALLAIALRDSDDPWIRAAVLSSARPHAMGLLTLLIQDREHISDRTALLEGLIATALGDNAKSATLEIGRLISRQEANAPLTPEDVEAWQVAALSSYLDALNRRKVSWAELDDTANQEGPSLAEVIAPIFAAGRSTSRNEDASLKERVAALALLGREPQYREEDVAYLTSLLSPRAPAEMQTAAVDVLEHRLGDELPPLLLADWRQHAPVLRSAIISTLLSREEWMEQLIDALVEGDVPPGDLDAAARQRLLTVWNQKVREAAQRLYGVPTDSDRAAVVDEHANVLGLDGHVERGAAVFKKVCSACHQHGGVGNDLAPKLSNVTNKSTEALLTSLLDPNQAVEQKYSGYIVLTTDGRTISGLIKSETAGSLILAEPSGKEHVILRIDIEQMQSTGKSFMPEGLEKDLSPQDMANVIAFVRSSPIAEDTNPTD